jgi:hypothetical protein
VQEVGRQGLRQSREAIVERAHGDEEERVRLAAFECNLRQEFIIMPPPERPATTPTSLRSRKIRIFPLLPPAWLVYAVLLLFS